MTDQEWARHWLVMLADSTGASVEPSDVARIAEHLAGIQRDTTTHGQLLAHMGALVTQYTKRGVS